MKMMSILIYLVLVITAVCMAKDWQEDYVELLSTGSDFINDDGPSKGVDLKILKKSIQVAINNNGSECKMLKIAINMGYSPYYALKFIFESGGKISLDELCMCATELGIMKSITAKAASDAVDLSNKSIFNVDEVAQSQCLGGEEGLPYTPSIKGLEKIKTSRDHGDGPYGSVFTFR